MANVIKFTADVNIEKPIVDYLVENGHDVKWISDYNREIPDKDLLKLAAGVILLRIKGQHMQDKITLIEKLLTDYSDKVFKHFTVIKRKSIRFKPMEDIK